MIAKSTGLFMDPIKNTNAAECAISRPFVPGTGINTPALKVMYYVEFLVGFNEYDSASSTETFASGVGTHSQRWTIFDEAASMLALAPLTLAYLLF